MTKDTQMPPLPVVAWRYDVQGDWWLTNDHEKAALITQKNPVIEPLCKVSDAQAYADQQVAAALASSTPEPSAVVQEPYGYVDSAKFFWGKPPHGFQLTPVYTHPPTAQLENGKTGWPPGMLQDDCKGLSKWLSDTPNARQEARIAATPPPVTGEAADAVQWEHVGTVARTVMRIDVGWLKDLPAGTYLYAAIALPVQPADDIHPCSFSCNLPDCIKTQRDLLRDQLCKKATP